MKKGSKNHDVEFQALQKLSGRVYQQAEKKSNNII